VVITNVNNQVSVFVSGGDIASTSTKFFNAATVRGISVFGDNGDDRIVNATSIPMTAYGQTGNDVLIGGWGADCLDGGDGTDWIDGGAGNDTLYGGTGNDLLLGNAGNDLLYGGDGDDILHGGDGYDSLFGNAGNDVLAGGSGLDSLKDSQGRNTFIDSGMFAGRFLGFYQGSWSDNYREGQFLSGNLKLGDVMKLTKQTLSPVSTGYGTAVDQIINSGWSTVGQNLAMASPINVPSNPATALWQETIDQMYPG
jgi:Ca2+-binding RTX toxin-like protein